MVQSAGQGQPGETRASDENVGMHKPAILTDGACACALNRIRVADQ
jgi:hypothetical protein